MSGSSNAMTAETPEVRRGKLELAANNCREMLKENPQDAHCLHVLALIEAQLGREKEATLWIEKALEIQPNSPDILCNYGIILTDQKRYGDAVEAFRRAIGHNPNNVEAYYHCGNALYGLGQYGEAMQAYEHVLKERPDHVDALNNLGNIYKNLENFDEAYKCYHRVLVIQPNYLLALNNMGLTLTAAGRFEEALAYFQRALALKPVYPEAMNNMGVALRLQGKFRESREWYRKALSIRPDYAEAWNNLGNVLKDLGDLKDAIEAYQRAITLQDAPDKRHNLSMAFLTAGDFEQGWGLYENRWQSKQMSLFQRHFRQSIWRGEEGKGRTLLIHAEQGYGDSIQFCRYAPLAAARGFKVVLEVQPHLERLMQSLGQGIQIVRRGKELPDFDVHCPMMSLPLVMGTTLNSIPAVIPYLHEDKEMAAMWRHRLAGAESFLKVGLVWSGNPRLHSLDSAAADRRRSIPFEFVKSLIDISHIKFYSLQKDEMKKPPVQGLLDYMAECRDFADTAALVANLDLVISVDTAVAHLAGAMGKPVWLLNRYDTCWRWLREREDSPWYPTLCQFRQPEPGDWESVIKAVKKRLSFNPDEKEKFIKDIA